MHIIEMENKFLDSRQLFFELYIITNCEIIAKSNITKLKLLLIYCIYFVHI